MTGIMRSKTLPSTKMTWVSHHPSFIHCNVLTVKQTSPTSPHLPMTEENQRIGHSGHRFRPIASYSLPQATSWSEQIVTPAHRTSMYRFSAVYTIAHDVGMTNNYILVYILLRLLLTIGSILVFKHSVLISYKYTFLN
jgi:hypothetical protein